MASSTSTSTFTDSQTTTASLLPLVGCLYGTLAPSLLAQHVVGTPLYYYQVQQQLIDCVGWSDIRSVTNHELPHLVGVRPLKVADAAEEAGGDDASTSTPEPQPGDGLIAVVQPGERCLIFPVASMHTTSPARCVLPIVTHASQLA